MTQGGFYRHFKTKDELVIQALRAAFDDFAQPLESLQQSESEEVVTAECKSLYLSQEHVDNPGVGCPMPALGGDLARESEAVKAEFNAGFRRVRSALAAAQKGTPEDRDAAAMRQIALLVGAVLLARAGTPAMACEILEACRSHSFASGTRDFLRHARV